MSAAVRCISLLHLQKIKASIRINNRISSLLLNRANMSASGDQGSSCFMEPRAVVKKVFAEQVPEGEGGTVGRSIGGFELRRFDPFLLLDEFSASPPVGFPDHPHRGFETVTYVLGGAFRHEDFTGHKGLIRAGDLQWMTAGRGILHSEMPVEPLTKGLQLWVNLASKDKLVEPKYQELTSAEIATAEETGVKVRVIAGESMGVQSQIFTRTPTMYLDFTMQPGASLSQPTPKSYNAFVYTLEGEGIFGSESSEPVPAHYCLVLSSGDGLRVWNKSSKPLKFVLIGGQPIGEPVVQYGPFVMNTQAEIRKAFEDYRYCKNGFEPAKHWRSSQ